MATFEQLEPRQRAILELVIRRGQSYEDLSDTLGLAVPRVRELARQALVELAPTTSASVDPQWRGQLADYLLGQQTGPESRATQGHLRSSEDARLWAYSLVDALDSLFEEDGRPDIPTSTSAKAPRRSRRAGRRGAAPDDAGEPSAGAATRPARARERGEARPTRARDRGAASGPAEGPGAASTARRERAPAGEEPAEQAAPTSVGAPVRRQRRLAVIAGIVVLALVIAGAVYAFAGGEEEQRAAPPPRPAQPAGTGQPRVLGQLPLRPLPGEKGRGIAVLVDQNGQRGLVVQARGIEGVGRNELLEVWFYNSRGDARSIGAQRVQNGTFQGLGALPPDWQRYRFVDVSREPADRNPAHSGESVLRGALADIQAPPSRGASPPER
jgi:hypothetical protein